ncbi:hypothetical protein AAULR_11185, partial [Lacticaseibacillus rhamnosus MTCC 5462]
MKVNFELNNFELNNWFYKSQPFVVAIFLCSKTWMNKKSN